MPGEKGKQNLNAEPDYHSNQVPPTVSHSRKHKKSVEVNDLSGRVCYFSLAGNLALKAFEESKLSTFRIAKRGALLKQELTNRLYFAVLMFDTVVLHCSDPLRSQIVLSVLEENSQWIVSGKIVFIFSNQIKDIVSDYRKYIQQKISDYSEGYYTEKEAASLSQDHITDEYYDRVIRLLDMVPFLVRKSVSESNSFDRLVLQDLSAHVNHENVVVDSTADISKILSLGLSLHQLLNIQLFTSTGTEPTGEVVSVFPPDTVKEVSTSIDEHLEQGNTIARSAIVDALTDKMTTSFLSKVKQRKFLLKAITLRMDVLYCRMNSGKQLILEFHPSYENRSIYQTDCFQIFLSHIAERDIKNALTHDKIDLILDDEHLHTFRLLYLACMADTRECMSFSQTYSGDPRQYHADYVKRFKDILDSYYSETHSTQFNLIKEVLRGEV